MATWEDGPEYAPLQRPDGFTTPAVAPLETPPPQPIAAGHAPIERPGFAEAPQPGPALASIAPSVADERDPHRPFEVATTAMTESTSAWSAQVATTAPGADPSAVNPAWGPPTSAPVQSAPDPSQPFQLGLGQAASGAPFPAPGTVSWFAPPPPTAQPVGAQPTSTVEALTLGYILVLGASLIFPLAPFTLTIGAILSRRVKGPGGTMVRRIAVGAMCLWVLIVLITILAVPDDFGSWWQTIGIWAMLIAFALLITSIAVVFRSRTASAPPRSNWG